MKRPGLHDLVKQIKLYAAFAVSVADMLDDHERRIGALEQESKKQRELHDGLNTRVVKNEQTLSTHIRNAPPSGT